MRYLGGSVYSLSATSPINYQGKIDVKIQRGGIEVTSSDFPSASPGLLKITTGQYWPEFGQTIEDGFDALRSTHYHYADWTMPESGWQGMGPIGDPNVVTNSKDLSKKSVSMNVNLSGMVGSAYYGWMSAILNGTVTLPGGKVIVVRDRWATFKSSSGGYSGDTPFAQYLLSEGVFYLDPNDVQEASPNPKLISSSEVLGTGLSPKGVSDLFDKPSEIIGLERKAFPENAFSAPRLDPSVGVTRDVLASPLSSSRIFPEVGSFR